MSKHLPGALIGIFMILVSLNGIISGETFGIGFSRGPDRYINPTDDFYEYWFINLFGLYWGVVITYRTINGKTKK